MRRLALLTLLLLMVGGTASAASVSGSGALALAVLVAEPSPLLPPGEKAVMARLLNGILTFAFPASRTISVKADKIVCRASNVDISFHSCALTFGSKTINLKDGAHTNCLPPSARSGCRQTAPPARCSKRCRISIAPSIRMRSSKRLAAARAAVSIRAPTDKSCKVGAVAAR